MKPAAFVLMLMLVPVLGSACAPAQPITEPDLVIITMYEALNKDDIDGAMAFIADDALFVTATVFRGKDGIREFMQGLSDHQARYEVIDLQVEGEEVTWTLKGTMDVKSFERPIRAEIQDGKIVKLFGTWY